MNPAPASTDQHGSGGTSPSRRWLLALVAALGVLLSVGGFLGVRHAEQERVRQEFAWRARSHAQSLAVVVQEYQESLYSMRDFFVSAGGLGPAAFQKTATELRARHPGIRILEWLPLVSSAERERFETEARREVSPDFAIRRGDAGDPRVPGQRRVTRSEERAEYAPVLYVNPQEEYVSELGVDGLQGQFESELKLARDTGATSASGRVPCSGAGLHDSGWLLFLPVFMEASGRQPQPGNDPTLLRGFLTGAFRFSELLSTSINEHDDDDVDVLLMDQTPGATEPLLFYAANGVSNSSAAPREADFRRGLHLSAPLRVGGRRWCAYFRPSRTWLEAQTTEYSYAFLLGGLALTGILTSAFRDAQQRARQVERLVRQRTAELHASEEALRRDVAERAAAERALRASEERYRVLIANSTEAIWRLEFDLPLSIEKAEEEQIDHFHSLAYLAECNDAVARLYGYERAEQIIGSRLSDLMPKSDPVNLEHLRAYVRNHFHIENSESHEVDRTGQPRVFLNNLIGIIENGYLVRVWGTQRDITAQRRAEAQRQESEAQLRLALAAADLGTWEWDLQGDRVIWSDGAERMFGFARGAFDGSRASYLKCVHPEDRAEVEQTLAAAIDGRGEIAQEHRIVRADGSIRWVTARGDVVRDASGGAVRVLGAVMDVTAQRQAAEDKAQMEAKLQETQKLESLGVLAGGIAHDFNNLLTSILGNASLARLDLPFDAPAHECLEGIETGAQRAAELCKQMLAYSGRGRFVVQRLDLSRLVSETAELLHASVSKNAALELALDPQLPPISADATQLRQIVMNLVINASDAIGAQPGVIRIATGVMHADQAFLAETHLSPRLPEGEYVFLEVSDNGCGMSAETRRKIFDPFFTTKFTGRGLGLAAVLGIVRGHCGALKVSSEPGRGTTFKLLLPRAEGPVELPPRPAKTAGGWRGEGRVLVVDDEETVRAVAARMLAHWGFATQTAANGREGVELLRNDPGGYVAVLLDLTMPQMGGGEAFQEMRAISPEVRVLLMSGFNEQDAVHRFAGQGLAGFLQKPFKPEALLEKLRSILEREVSA